MGDLVEYWRKRRFQLTREPRGMVRPRPWGRPQFVVQLHQAARAGRHYDFRLEIGGVLVSWAVPKGPSRNPSVRRQAIQTEDHPIEYAGFEGRIPEGEYGAGPVLIWDRGTYEPKPGHKMEAMLEAGHIVFELKGQRLKGSWLLQRTSGVGTKSDWLLIKQKDEHANTTIEITDLWKGSVVSGRLIDQI